MRRVDIISRASKNLRQAKVRTILTSLAIGVGAFTIALAMAAGTGGRAFTDEMIATSGDVYSLNVYPKYEPSAEPTDTLAEYGVAVEEELAQDWMTEKDITWLEDQVGVESIRPMLYIESEYVTRGEGYTKRVAPISVKADRTEVKLAAGSLQDNMPSAGQVTIPESYLEALGFDTASDAIGKPLYIHLVKITDAAVNEDEGREFAFTIAAVDRPSDTTVYYEEAVRISSQDSVEMYAYQHGETEGQHYYGVTVLAKQGADVKALQDAIDQEGYGVYSLEDMREQLLQMVNIAQWGLAGFGALAILASIFGIINTQYISVLERTQQIGLMKALGMRGRDISKLFRYEAAWIGLLGGVIGVALAWLVTLANPLLAEMAELEAGTQLLKTDWLANLALVVILILIAVASGYFPSRKAAKLNPIDALRTE